MTKVAVMCLYASGILADQHGNTDPQSFQFTKDQWQGVHPADHFQALLESAKRAQLAADLLRILLRPRILEEFGQPFSQQAPRVHSS